MSTLLIEHERRASQRWATRRELRWRTRGGRRGHTGVVVERSLNGLVLEADAGEAPEVGAYIKPETGEMASRHGFRVGVVVRRGADQDGRSVVYVEILG